MKHETFRKLILNQLVIPDAGSFYDEALSICFETFEHEEFNSCQAECPTTDTVWNAWKDEEWKFFKADREFSIERVHKDCKFIRGNVISNVKANDDGSLRMKAIIALHRDNDKEIVILNIENRLFSMFSCWNAHSISLNHGIGMAFREIRL